MVSQPFGFEDGERQACTEDGLAPTLVCANICNSSDYLRIVEKLSNLEYVWCFVAGKFGEFAIPVESPVPMVGLGLKPRNLSRYNIYLLQAEYGVGSIGFKGQKKEAKEYQFNFCWFYPTHMSRQVFDHFLQKCQAFRRKRVTNTIDFTFAPHFPLNIEQGLNEEELSKFEDFFADMHSDEFEGQLNAEIIVELRPKYHVATRQGTPRIYTRPPFRHVNRRRTAVTTCIFMQGCVSLPVMLSLDKSDAGEVLSHTVPNLTRNPFTVERVDQRMSVAELLPENALDFFQRHQSQIVDMSRGTSVGSNFHASIDDYVYNFQESERDRRAAGVRDHPAARLPSTPQTYGGAAHLEVEPTCKRGPQQVDMDPDMQNRMRMFFGSVVEGYNANIREEEQDRRLAEVREARQLARDTRRADIAKANALKALQAQDPYWRDPNRINFGNRNFQR